MAKWETKQQMLDLLCELVEIPSITGSDAEIEFPKHVMRKLQGLPYFQEQGNGNHLKLHLTGDGRYFVTAFVKNSDAVKNTVILLSHFDVVDVQDYGEHMADAFHPREITKEFYERKEELPETVRKDITNGEWLFGRGTMDMKCGLALHMSMVEEACHGRFDGNVLLLTVPDEEVNSLGMRAAVPVLLHLAEEYGLMYQMVLNSEPMFTRYPGDDHAYVYTGSIGKVLPGFLCYGKETHVGEPLSGLNGNYMASKLTCAMELNTALCEQAGNDITPPPTNLIQKGLKDDYSVQIPHRAVTLFNLFAFEKSMDELVRSLRQTAESVASEIEQEYAKRAADYAQLHPFSISELGVRVLTYDELRTYAVQNHGLERVTALEQGVISQKGTLDERDTTIQIVDQVSILCKELAPMIVLFFAPPYYPSVCSQHHERTKRVVREMCAYADEKYDVTLVTQNYFGGISDLSFVGLQHPAAALQPLLTNMPLWGKGYSLPLADLERFNVPVLNFGPIGRDAHKWTERLNVNYAFETLREMLPVCIQSIMSDGM